MEGYLGEFDVDISTSKYKDYTQSDWAMLYIEMYGQIDGSHHKAWVLDRVAQILKGTPVIVSEARWENGHSEYRFKLDSVSSDYIKWVNHMMGEFDEETQEHEYGYDTGIAP